MTKINVITPQIPSPLIYGDVICVNSPIEKPLYYLIAQTDYSVITLFCLNYGTISFNFNRSFAPIQIDNWCDLNTDTIKQLIPSFEGSTITKVSAEITIKIN